MYFTKDRSGHRVDVDFGRREPAEGRGDYERCLLAAMYAWDSNSFPGNEYYLGMLSASGDPAAASCSTISFVQNAEINHEYINGESTRVYFYNPHTKKSEFQRLGDIDFEKDDAKWLKMSR